jgi:hypothetical protein
MRSRAIKQRAEKNKVKRMFGGSMYAKPKAKRLGAGAVSVSGAVVGPFDSGVRRVYFEHGRPMVHVEFTIRQNRPSDLSAIV